MPELEHPPDWTPPLPPRQGKYDKLPPRLSLFVTPCSQLCINPVKGLHHKGCPNAALGAGVLKGGNRPSHGKGTRVRIALPGRYGDGFMNAMAPKGESVQWLKEKISKKLGAPKGTETHFSFFLVPKVAEKPHNMLSVLQLGASSSSEVPKVPLADDLSIALLVDGESDDQFLQIELSVRKEATALPANPARLLRDESFITPTRKSSSETANLKHPTPQARGPGRCETLKEEKGYEPSLQLYAQEMQLEGHVTPFRSFRLLGEESFLFADGSTFLKDGKTVALESGERVPAVPPSEDALWIGEDWSCLLPNGAMQFPSGGQTTPGGMVRMPSGEEQETLWPLLPFGTILLPTGTLVLPNGSLKFADGCCMLGMELQLSKLGGDKVVTLREESADSQEDDGTRLIDGTSQLANGSIRLPSGCVTLACNRDKLMSPNEEILEAMYELPCIKQRVGPIVMPNYEWNNQAYSLYVMQLHRAAQSANYPKVLSCLKSGCDPNTKDELGNTALHLTPCITTALILIKHGARLDTRNECEPSRAAADLFVYDNLTQLADAALDYLRANESKWDDYEEYKAFLKQMLPTARATIVREEVAVLPPVEEAKSMLRHSSMYDLGNVPMSLTLTLSCANLVALKPKMQPLCSTMIGVYLLEGDEKNPSSRLIGQTEWIMHAANPQFDRRVVLKSADANFSNAKLRFSVHDCDKTKHMQPSNLIGETTLKVDDILARSEMESADEDIAFLYESDDDDQEHELEPVRPSMIASKPFSRAVMCSEVLANRMDAKIQERLLEAHSTLLVQANFENETGEKRKTITTELKYCGPGSTWIDLSFQCENLPQPGKAFAGYKITVFSRMINKQKGFQFLGHTDWITDASNPSFQKHVKLGHNISEAIVLKVMVYSNPYRTEKEHLVGQTLVALQSLLSTVDSQESYRLRNENDQAKHKLLKNQAATVSIKFQADPIDLLEEVAAPSQPLEMALSVRISGVPNPTPFQGTPSVAIMQQQQLAGCRYDIMALISKGCATKWTTPFTHVDLPARMSLSGLPAETGFRIDVHDAKNPLQFVESEQIGSVPFSLEEILTFERPKELVSATKKKSALFISVLPMFFGQMDVTISCRNLVKIGTFNSNCDPVAMVFRIDDGNYIGQTERQKHSLHPSFQNTVRVTGDQAKDWQVRITVFSSSDRYASWPSSRTSDTVDAHDQAMKKNKIGSAVVDLAQLAYQRNSSFFSYPLTSDNKTMNKRLQDKGAELCVTLSLVGQRKKQRSVKPEPMHGVLTKRGGSKRTWQKRFVQLHSGILSYWDSKDKAPLGQLSVRGAHVYTYTNPIKGMRGVFSIRALGCERIFYFRTAELSERARWCKALQDHGALMRQLVDDCLFKKKSFGKLGESLDTAQ